MIDLSVTANFRKMKSVLVSKKTVHARLKAAQRRRRCFQYYGSKVHAQLVFDIYEIVETLSKQAARIRDLEENLACVEMEVAALMTAQIPDACASTYSGADV